jgi:hypothetical protein
MSDSTNNFVLDLNTLYPELRTNKI